ncbi:hypothetical protein E3N88_37561 [Mikania micrantha]|uniref:Uncharacterized protein n=1 Tax=Mikania micrantha TaxID=192012 RepID=A0A5N6LRG3_9ASTR|nr:hypothetical protein E3N88_37561 [Mikania micrantha]
MREQQEHDCGGGRRGGVSDDDEDCEGRDRGGGAEEEGDHEGAAGTGLRKRKRRSRGSSRNNVVVAAYSLQVVVGEELSTPFLERKRD